MQRAKKSSGDSSVSPTGLATSGNSSRRALLLACATSALFGLSACGGDSDSSFVLSDPDNKWVAGQFKPSDEFADMCANTRSGIDPTTDQPYPDVQGFGIDERNFLRSWSNETYLWYDEIADQNPANYDTLEYFDLLKTEALTASGNPKDNFHSYVPTHEWQSLSQSGVSVGYGATWVIISGAPPRELVVAYVEPGSPADNENLTRGARILEIDGADVVNGNDLDTLNAGLSPSEDGEEHTFLIQELDDSERDITLAAEAITVTPVSNSTVANGEVGYILFNDHIATAEEGLVDAVEELQNANVQDLVLDVRYNGGGYLAIASQLAYMIAGPSQTNDRAFETLSFNDKRSDQNTAIPFYGQTLGLSMPEGQPLPTLNLDRVFVLTGPDSCSASESIINGLRGVDVEVIQIGSTTCGKPYGFYPEDNCGTTYFTIQFKGENAKGFGDYPDGFSPQDTVGEVGESLPGCSVPDDYTKPLGDPGEGRLAAALHYRNTPNEPCGFTASQGQSKVGASSSAPSTLSAIDGRVIKSPALQGRIMRK